MRKLTFACCFLSLLALSWGAFEETMSDMLIQCNKHQSQMFDNNRTSHECEKDGFSEDFSYVIEPMLTRYAKKKFWCFLFLKDDYFKLKFKLWLSHKNYFIDAFGVKFSNPVDDKFESRVAFKIAPMVVAAKKGFALPEVLGFELNGVERCPICGRKIESAGEVAKWPWHAVVYRIQPETLAYHCGGTLIKSNTVITAAHCVTEKGRKLSEHSFQVGLGESEALDNSGVRSAVFRSIVHDGFDHYSLENNVALLMLETQVKFSSQILPICLPTKGLSLDGTGVVVGFVDREDQQVLRSVEIPIASRDDCIKHDTEFFESPLHEDNFCAGKRDSKSVCGADVGGGIYVKKGTTWILKGITSNIKSGAVATNPLCEEFALFVDVSRHLTWIDEIIESI